MSFAVLFMLLLIAQTSQGYSLIKGQINKYASMHIHLIYKPEINRETFTQSVLGEWNSDLLKLGSTQWMRIW